MNRVIRVTASTSISIGPREVQIKHYQLGVGGMSRIFKNEAEIVTGCTSNGEMRSIMAHLENYDAKEGCRCTIFEDLISVPVSDGWVFVLRTGRGLSIRSSLAFRWGLHEHNKNFYRDMENIGKIVISLEDLFAQVEERKPGTGFLPPVALRSARA